MGHNHDHGHSAPKDFGKAFIIGIALNIIFIICEIIYGLKANSLALLADAGHNASDVTIIIDSILPFIKEYQHVEPH